MTKFSLVTKRLLLSLYGMEHRWCYIPNGLLTSLYVTETFTVITLHIYVLSKPTLYHVNRKELIERLLFLSQVLVLEPSIPS